MLDYQETNILHSFEKSSKCYLPLYAMFYCLLTSHRSSAVKNAAALETKSSHPVAAAIVNHFSGCITDKIAEFGSQINLPDVSKFKNEGGMGLSGVVGGVGGGCGGKAVEGGVLVLVGNLDLMKLYDVEVNDKEIEILHQWASHGKTVVFVATDNKVYIFNYYDDSHKIFFLQLYILFEKMG